LLVLLLDASQQVESKNTISHQPLLGTRNKPMSKVSPPPLLIFFRCCVFGCYYACDV
jgi:hypothetical protein